MGEWVSFLYRPCGGFSGGMKYLKCVWGPERLLAKAHIDEEFEAKREKKNQIEKQKR